MIQSVNGIRPDIPREAYVHPGAAVIGQVKLGKHASVWPGAVIRGDMAAIIVGERTSIQDGCVLHTDTLQLRVGSDVTVGHRAVLHSCDIEDGALIGMGAIVLDAAKVGKDSIVGAGALVPPGFVVPPGTVVMGVPCKVVREVKPDEIEENKRRCGFYMEDAKAYIKTGEIL